MTGCAVCGGSVHPAERIDSEHHGVRYEFCSDEHRTEFEALPGEFV
ncbi:TRASH domain-containing protein [Halostella sp. JP-L12]|nr:MULTISPECIES: TRASH domain-containing protein [Halostella]NHN49412.1 TRASH domain-containing protein [Halostella sp. JP-L12]